MADVLVTVDHEDGVAGVVLEDGEHWLSGYVGDGGTLVDVYGWAVHGLTGDRTAEGGVLPPVAVGAEVVDRTGTRRMAVVGRGAWVIVLDEPATGALHPVRFVDSDGRTVPRPLPQGWPRRPIDDVSEPCPACGGVGWDEVRPQGEGYGTRPTPDGGWETTPVFVCRSCGHQEPAGAVISLTFDVELDAHELERLQRAEDERQRAQARAVVSRCRFPLYRVVGLAPEIGGYGEGDRGVTQVTLVHATGVDVRTVREDYAHDGALELARQELDRQLYEDGQIQPSADADTSEGALWLTSSARRRELSRLVATARTDHITVNVDGKPVTFELATRGDCWGAAAYFGGLAVVIGARNQHPDQIQLTRLAGPEELAADPQAPLPPLPR
jgi:hypothetical protein